MASMESGETRLAAALAAWARSEIERGFDVYTHERAAVRVGGDGGYQVIHVAVSLGGVKDEGASLGPGDFRSSYEGAARALVERITSDSIAPGYTPDRWVIVWRTPPELAAMGEYEKRVTAYCRFCYVRKEDAHDLVDCIRVV